MTLRWLSLSALLTFLPSLAAADLFETRPSCYQPQKPNMYGDPSLDSYRTEAFGKEVEQYRFCIESFVREQEKQMQVHQRAIHWAKEEWDIFEKRVLRKGDGE